MHICDDDVRSRKFNPTAGVKPTKVLGAWGHKIEKKWLISKNDHYWILNKQFPLPPAMFLAIRGDMYK